MEKTILFVDDRRVPPFGHIRVASVEEAVRWLASQKNPQLDELWLDYDLGVDQFGIQQTTWPLIEELVAGAIELAARILKIISIPAMHGLHNECSGPRDAGFTAVEQPLP